MTEYNRLVNGEIIPMTPEQVKAFIAQSAIDTAMILKDDRRVRALTELSKSDGVAIRCTKSCVAYPQEWLNRDEILRAIVRGEHHEFPEELEYPEGT